MCNGTEHTALISFATKYFYLINEYKTSKVVDYIQA